MIRKRIFSIVYMFLLTFLFTAMVSGVYEINRERIAINEEIKLQKIILKVLGIKVVPETPDIRIQEIFGERVKLARAEDRIIYRGFAEDGKTLIGYAIPLVGPGFWGPIYGMGAIDPNLDRVLGIAFYRHSETPGLGGRITEEWFEEQFKGRKLLTPGKNRRYFSFLPPGRTKAENEIDAITGATGTSKAVERLIDRNLKEYLPWIAKERAEGRI